MEENSDLLIIIMGDVNNGAGGVVIDFTIVVDSTMFGSPRRLYVNQFLMDD